MVLKKAGIQALKKTLMDFAWYARWCTCDEFHCEWCEERLDREVEEVLDSILAITGTDTPSRRFKRGVNEVQADPLGQDNSA